MCVSAKNVSKSLPVFIFTLKSIILSIVHTEASKHFINAIQYILKRVRVHEIHANVCVNVCKGTASGNYTFYTEERKCLCVCK